MPWALLVHLFPLFRTPSQEEMLLPGASSPELEALLLFSVSTFDLWAYSALANTYIAAVGGVFEFIKLSSANLREKDDSLNTALGGFLAGTVLGLRRKP